MFGWEFPPFKAGGLATATVGLVTGLLGRGVQVCLVVPFAVRESTIPGLDLVSASAFGAAFTRRRIDAALVPYTSQAQYAANAQGVFERPAPDRVYGADLLADVDRFAAAAATIAREEPHDVIDAHDWIAYAAGLHAQAASGRPLVAHIHATERDRSGSGANPVIVERERQGLHAAQRIISNSHMMKARVVADYGVPPHLIDVIPWGIDGVRPLTAGPRSRPLRGSPVVLFLGRVTQQKGPGIFIELARRVVDFLPEARFIVAGDGDELPRVIRQAAELGLGDKVFFTGGLHGPDVDRAYQAADVCVMPSLSEPFGLVALESLRNGTPCIVPRASGVAEALTHVFKADFWDIDAMTDMIVALTRFPVLHAEMRRRGLEELAGRRFDLDEPARLTEAAYRRVLSQGPVSRD